MKKVGLRSIRMRLGLTQTELAMMLGVSQTLVVLSESGERDLPARAWQKFSLPEFNICNKSPTLIVSL